jgi:hypothetical protein
VTRFCIVIFATASLTVGCNKPKAISASLWREYTSPEGRFSVLLPGEPTPSEVAGGFKGVKATIPEPLINFVVYYSDSPTKPNPQKYFDNFKNEIMPKEFARAKLVREADIQINGNPGHEFILLMTDTNGFLFRRIYFVGNRLYILSVAGSGWKDQTPDSQKFFDSFKVN